MKTSELLKALDLAKPSLGGADSLLPVLSHFVFVEDVVYAYNDVTAVMIDLAHGLSCALHGDTLLGILNVAGEEVAIKPGKAGSFELRTPTGWVKVPALAAEDSPFLPPDEELILSLPIDEELLKAIAHCMISVGQDSLKPEFAGVTVQAAPPRVVCYSSDNKSASRFEFAGKFVGRKMAVAVLPMVACDLLTKLAAACGTDGATLGMGAHYAVASFTGASLVTKVLPAQPALFTTLFENHVNEALTRLTLPDNLTREVTKASILVGKDTVKEVRLDFSKGGVRISAAGTLGSMETALKAETDGAASVVCEPDTLLRALPLADHWLPNDGRSIVLSGAQFTHIIAATSNRTEE